MLEGLANSGVEPPLGQGSWVVFKQIEEIHPGEQEFSCTVSASVLASRLLLLVPALTPSVLECDWGM